MTCQHNVSWPKMTHRSLIKCIWMCHHRLYNKSQKVTYIINNIIYKKAYARIAPMLIMTSLALNFKSSDELKTRATNVWVVIYYNRWAILRKAGYLLHQLMTMNEVKQSLQNIIYKHNWWEVHGADIKLFKTN